MLERGIAVRQGIGFLRTELPTILATRTDALSPRMLRVIEEFAGDWRFVRCGRPASGTGSWMHWPQVTTRRCR
jgi:hypothetical protein